MPEPALESLPEIPTIEYRITLVPRDAGWCWLRSDGEWVSPIFSTADAAKYFVGKIPFLSDAEWKLHHPIPQHLWEVLKNKKQTLTEKK